MCMFKVLWNSIVSAVKSKSYKTFDCSVCEYIYINNKYK